MKPRSVLFFIVCLTLVTAFINLPAKIPINLHLGSFTYTNNFTVPEFKATILGKQVSSRLPIKQGLDLQGGTRIVLEADMKSIPEIDRQTALDGLKEVISRRIDLFGVNEPVIQTSKINNQYRIVAELPGIQNVDQALSLIGTTAQLDFRELESTEKLTDATPAGITASFKPTGLTGKHLKSARVEFDSNVGKPVVAIEFDNEGSKLFSEITQRNIGKPLAIFLDNAPVTVPQVNEAIVGGKAVISGSFTTDEAKSLSIQLNAGALPVSVNVVEQKNIGAKLGQDSVTKSVQAGLFGIGLVMLFMILYYGKLGLFADIALVIYGLITLALYKLIPVTVSLPGLAGFMLSIGMAVDSNILIFERYKEEVKNGRPTNQALELGFGRAWDSIKDANVATLMTAFILFNPLNWSFLNTSGLVRGFAFTLSLGVAVSLFTGIVVTRTLLRVFYKPKQ